jgi:hypothetical protein
MNIIEAVKSGKRFRRKIWVSEGYSFYDDYDKLQASDIAAEDWEIEEPIVTVTYSQFWTTYRNIRFDPKKSEYDIVAELADRLGLKP